MAAIVESLIEKCLGMLSVYVEGEIFKILGVKKEIKKLRRRLERIRAFLQDAERKRHEEATINTWVRELKDLMYDADDILDLCMLKGGKLLEFCSADSGVFSLCMHSTCFKCIKYRCEVASRIQKLNGRLKEIAEDREIIPRLQYVIQKPQHNTSFSRPTYSLEVESDIVGTEIADAAQDLINRIIQNDEQNCQIFGIIGMGGIGKTTLARKIFNDEKIKDKFPLRVWLYVSRNYSEIALLSDMIRSVGGHVEAGENKTQLADKLASLLSRNLFLVLDDVWSADVWWNLIRDPIIISRGVKSRVLVTTRDQMVVRSMQANYIHRVEKMRPESGWALLCRVVFQAEGQGNYQIDMLKETGIRIVEKCDGLPLAIKVIGGVLRCRERSKMEWERALASDSWRMNRIDEELPRALYLSYDDLPLHLKQCFLYCSLFPISRFPDLLPLWLAEGFIVEQSDRSMEATAEECYRELLWRNLLQSDPFFVDQNVFIMHDLLRSLGESLVEGEGVSLMTEQRLDTNSLTKIRRLWISNKKEIGLVLPDLILKQKCLRSLLVFNSPQIKTISNHVVQRLKHLRVLYLGSTAIETLPNSIGELQHLRYLNLSDTKIHGIPESIGRLANLQTLVLANCNNLHVLPKATTRLHNLRFLSLTETPLTHTPKGIGSLKNLSVLSGFIVGRDEETSSSTSSQGGCPLFLSKRSSQEGCDLEELRSLSKMRCLWIVRLERATLNESTSAGSSVLSNMPSLEEVFFEWTTGSFQATEEDEEDQLQVNAEKVLDQLSPPSTMQYLGLTNFPGQRFARWMMCMDGRSFPNLAYIMIENLPSCAELPRLGQLPQLKFFRVYDARAIQTISPEFFQSSGGGHPGAPVFPKLEAIELRGMPNWEEWQLSMEDINVDGRGNLMLLPALKKCVIRDCPELRALPECLRHATNLKELFVWEAHSLMEISDLPSLTEMLNVAVMLRLEKISNLPSLKYLEITNCPSLEQVERLDTLQHLVLKCPWFVQDLPEWVSALVEQRQGAPTSAQRRSFRKFELYCGNLSLFYDCLREGINWPIIQQIPQVKIQTIDGKRFILYSKDPQTYETNVVLDSERAHSVSTVLRSCESFLSLFLFPYIANRLLIHIGPFVIFLFFFFLGRKTVLCCQCIRG